MSDHEFSTQPTQWADTDPRWLGDQAPAQEPPIRIQDIREMILMAILTEFLADFVTNRLSDPGNDSPGITCGVCGTVHPS